MRISDWSSDVCSSDLLDSWVGQTAKYAAEGVAVWAEALGGSVTQRAQTLVARGLVGSDPREGARRSIAWAGLNTDAYRFRDNTAGRGNLWRDLQDGPASILEGLALDSRGQRERERVVEGQGG